MLKTYNVTTTINYPTDEKQVEQIGLDRLGVKFYIDNLLLSETEATSFVITIA